MPSIVCLDDNIEETLTIIDEIFKTVLQNSIKYIEKKKSKSINHKSHINGFFDFSTIKYISPSAALIMASIYQRSKSITEAKVNTINEHKWDRYVAATLRSIGFHDLLEMRPFTPYVINEDTVRIQKFVSGHEVDSEKTGNLQSTLANLLSEQEKETFLDLLPVSGILEAIENSQQWAYEDFTSPYPILANWWLTGAVDTVNGVVTVVAYDQGRSIPVSLPNWKQWSQLRLIAARFLAKINVAHPIDHPSNDGIAIKLAMKLANTSSNLPERGKGLHTMQEVAQRAKSGRLRIISRNGEYVWETGKGSRSFSHEVALQGTLVEWRLQL